MKLNGMLLGMAALALIVIGLSGCGKSDAESGSTDVNGSNTTIVATDPTSEETPPPPKEEIEDADGWRRITFFDFTFNLDAQQSEPQGKNKDRFEAKTQFTPYVPHHKVEEAAPFQALCFLEITNQGRAPDSDQGDTTVETNPFEFHVALLWEPEDKTIHVAMTPRDVVQYRFRSKEIYGQGSVLEQLFKHATSTQLSDNLEAFSLPRAVEAPAEFTWKIATPKSTGSWFDGTATLKLVSRWTIEWDPQSESWSFIDKQGGEPDEVFLQMPPPERE